MFFFSWFSGKSRRPRHAALPRNVQPLAQTHERSPGDRHHDAEGKTKTHASREQLYEAIRESMTRMGILSSSYKFKVLSLDQRDSSYLVMLDLSHVAGDTVLQPAEMEALMVQNAMLRYQLAVSAVYWRISEVAAVNKLPSPFATVAVAQPVRKEALAHEPIEADEVAAFQHALLAASAHSMTPTAPQAKTKAGRGLRHSAHPQDFEDTELTQSVACPALSPTQYGDLN